MKTFLLSVACFVVLGSQAFAGQRDYQCISNGLQAYNSDVFYNLSKTEIDAMLDDASIYGHDKAVEVSERCNENSVDSRRAICVANSLEAYNSDMFYNLSQSEVESLLSDSGAYGHSEAVRAARICSKTVR